MTQQETELLMDWLTVLKVENGLTYEGVVMAAIQINTSEKMQALREYLKTKWSDNRFHLTQDELLNKTAEIDRMYSLADDGDPDLFEALDRTTK